jgi:alkanesulfonate monooxygenase SsuD/methylene tetrahydromethanopterin reductase-like flavin-dependent oxidoreductase (luciferase family)
MAATSPPTIRQAVQKGYHLMTGTGSTVEELDQRNQYIDYLFQQMGKSSAGIERHATRFVYCSTNQSDIDNAIDETIWQIRTATALNQGNHEIFAGRNRAAAVPYPGEPSRDVWQERLIFGNPDEVLRRLQRHADAGITYIFALFDFGGISHEKSWESMKLFTKEVMPAVPAITASAGARDIKDPNAFVAGAAGRYTGA